MKPRKVIITIEAKTDAPLKAIREALNVHKNVWATDDYTFIAHQVHVQVVKENQ